MLIFLLNSYPQEDVQRILRLYLDITYLDGMDVERNIIVDC